MNLENSHPFILGSQLGNLETARPQTWILRTTTTIKMSFQPPTAPPDQVGGRRYPPPALEYNTSSVFHSCTKSQTICKWREPNIFCPLHQVLQQCPLTGSFNSDYYIRREHIETFLEHIHPGNTELRGYLEVSDPNGDGSCQPIVEYGSFQVLVRKFTFDKLYNVKSVYVLPYFS